MIDISLAGLIGAIVGTIIAAALYGTLVIARAYAEWGVTSDRLAVYRAGVEPVYAPTFRFEADIPGQPSRGSMTRLMAVAAKPAGHRNIGQVSPTRSVSDFQRK